MAIESDILSEKFRGERIKEILGNENKKRKAESIRRVDVYKKKIKDFLHMALKEEYSHDTAEEMRTISSINPCLAHRQ